VWAVIINPDTPRKMLLAFRHQLIKSMSVWEERAPFSCLAYFFHSPLHILDMKISAGCVQQYWMFFFERFVSYLNRICKSRKNPEMNICTEMGVHMFMDEVTHSVGGLGGTLVKDDSDLARLMLNSIAVDDAELVDDDEVDRFNTTAMYKIPARLVNWRKSLLQAEAISELKAACDETKDLSGLFINLLENENVIVYSSVKKTWKINGLSRNTVMSEPDVGSSKTCIRKSGCKVVGSEILVAQICNFFVVNETELFVLVFVYEVEHHDLSTLHRVAAPSKKVAVLPAASLGDYVCFCPWTDRTKIVDCNHMCVLWKSYFGSYDTYRS